MLIALSTVAASDRLAIVYRCPRIPRLIRVLHVYIRPVRRLIGAQYSERVHIVQSRGAAGWQNQRWSWRSTYRVSAATRKWVPASLRRWSPPGVNIAISDVHDAYLTSRAPGGRRRRRHRRRRRRRRCVVAVSGYKYERHALATPEHLVNRGLCHSGSSGQYTNGRVVRFSIGSFTMGVQLCHIINFMHINFSYHGPRADLCLFRNKVENNRSNTIVDSIMCILALLR